MKWWSKPARALSASALVASILIALPGTASAYTVPFKDPNANGTIGFCDQNRHAVTSGSIYDKPFAWTAVSSIPAPAGYERGKALLIAFQPQKELDPAYWSGKQLTANSTFTNAKHPMAQATYADDPLLFFTQTYPPKWDGLVELRMYFSATNTPVHTIPYPAAVVRVTGTHWTLVGGSSTPACTSGSAESIEVRTLPRSVWASPKPLVVNGKVVSGPGAAITPTPTSNAAATTPIGSERNEGVGANVIVIIALLAMAVIGGGASGLIVWRRRRIDPNASTP